MTDDSEFAPTSIIESLPALIKRLRSHNANGSFAAADLLEAAEFTLTHGEDRDLSLGKLSNADVLRLTALRLQGE